jgi:uncharacterized Zn finger protein
MVKNLTLNLKHNEFLDHCYMCKHETVHEIVDHRPTNKETGLLGGTKIECQECGTTFWV